MTGKNVTQIYNKYVEIGSAERKFKKAISGSADYVGYWADFKKILLFKGQSQNVQKDKNRF